MNSKPTYEDLEKRVKALEQEVSERERIEEALRESQTRFQLLFEKAPLGYQSLDEDGNFINVNSAWLDILGYSLEEVIGKSFDEFLHPDWKNHFKENFPRFKTVGEVLGVEFKMIKKDGSSILVSFNGKIGKDKYGGFQQTHCILQNITERKLAEEALKESEERHKELFERSLDCIYVHDFEGNFISANPAALDLLGYTKEEITSLNFASLLSEDELLKAYNAVKDIIEKGAQDNLSEYKLKKKSGDYVCVESKGFLIYKDGRPYSIVGIARDITDRKETEKKLQRAHERLELRVKERTFELEEINKEIEVQKTNLEDANTALKVLLKKRDEDRIEIEEKILANFKELVMPLIDRLKESRLDERQKVWMDILGNNLRDIVSPFSRQLSSKFWGLTSQEFAVANFIKNGKTTKEIAKLLLIATSTVDTYRNNIRRKLDIKSKKINLKTYLSDIE